MKRTRSARGARLGQHFLTNVRYARMLAEVVAVRPEETILEIGPGKGALTRELLGTGAPVLAIEKDEALAAQLAETFAREVGSGHLEILPADVRDFDTKNIEGNYVVAANIPYYITGEIIRRFLTAAYQPRAIGLLIQKEVAERIVARDGKESILSISVKAYGTPRIVAKVSKGNFNPPPSVDSAILLIENISRGLFKNVSEDTFFALLHAGFGSKRKKLASNLKKQFGVIAELGNRRAEDLRLEEWCALAKRFTVPSNE